MARINIEDCWWTDPRRSKLSKLLGGEEIADGVAVRMWRVAQEFWGKSRGLVPAKIWNTLEHGSKLLEANLAEERADGVYVCGSSQWLDWVIEQKEKARIAGQKSAEVRRKKHGSAQPKPKNPRTKAEQVPNAPRTKVNDTEPSVSGSNSVSGSGLGSEVTVSSKQTKAGAFIVGYKSRFLFAYGTKANVEGKDAGIAKRVAERLSFDEIEIYLDAFFQMPDSELKKKKHPVFLFETKINEIAVFAQSGEFTTNRQAQQVDNAVSISSQLQRIREGKL